MSKKKWSVFSALCLDCDRVMRIILMESLHKHLSNLLVKGTNLSLSNSWLRLIISLIIEESTIYLYYFQTEPVGDIDITTLMTDVSLNSKFTKLRIL